MRLIHKTITDENNNEAYLMKNLDNEHCIVRHDDLLGWTKDFNSFDEIPSEINLANFIIIENNESEDK